MVKDISEFLKKQIELERRIVATADNSVKDMKNILVKEMIYSISLDSKKHESMLTALLAMQKSTQPFISETVSKELHENIKIHIELEQEAIQTYKELLEQVENEQVKMVIQAIYHDELRHHALLKKIYNVIIEKETLDEDEIWEFIKDDFIPQY
ncbi:MAG: hypothetical protein KAU62_12655 [Candidatus Heimdallarchaeota archaeon]|nr:hypothetical protein [Candidatus Heimdallarchaeota archaeon]MCK4612001.1 hypothetical protein [Candidatus Heimdallarchaeota archaeon]